MYEKMGKMTTGEKPKFDLIAASKTKKYKIIFGVVLALGILLFVGGIILHSTLTQAVTPNSLSIQFLSGLDNSECIISQDEGFALYTGTETNRPLANPIIFELDQDAQQFVEIRDKKNESKIDSYRYQGLFYLHVLPSAIDNATGKLKIHCGSKSLLIKLTYKKPA